MARALVVEILSDAKKFGQGFDQAERRLGQFDGKTRQATNTTSKFTGKIDAARTSLINMGKVAAGAAVLAFLKSSSDAASALNESINAVNSVFGDASETITEFGKISAQVTGLSAREFNQLATQTGALLTNMGFSMQEAGDEAIRLATRAADMASIFDTDVASALNAINSGLRGETEPLRRFGVTLSDAAIRAKAVELGLADTTAAVDANGKAVAALELIYEQTASAQGDFIETSGEVANAQRILSAEFENTQARFGQTTLGPKNFFLSAADDFLAGLNLIGLFGSEAKEAQQQAFLFQDALFAITEAARNGGDPITRLADGLVQIADRGELTTAQFESLALAAGLTRDQFEEFGQVIIAVLTEQGKPAELIEELEEAIFGTGEAASEAAPALGELGDETAAAGEEAGNAVASLKNLTAELRAQTSPVFGALRAWQSYQETIAQIDDDGQRTSEELIDLAEAAIDVVGAFGELSDQNLAEVFDTIGSAIGLTRQETEDLFRELGLFDGRTFTYSIVEQRSTSLSPELSDSGVRGFGGGRAHGGPVSSNTAYLVGERGPELFVPSSGGQIRPTGSFGGDNYVINVNVATEMSDVAPTVVRAIERALHRREREVA